MMEIFSNDKMKGENSAHVKKEPQWQTKTHSSRTSLYSVIPNNAIYHIRVSQ